jgi:hypothetical protein
MARLLVEAGATFHRDAADDPGIPLINPEALYRENGRNYRLFFLLRQAAVSIDGGLVAATLAVSGGLGAPAWSVAMGAAFMSGLLWLLDRRVRKLLQICYLVGQDLERGAGAYYSQVRNLGAGAGPVMRPSFARVMDWYYALSTLGLLLLGLSLLLRAAIAW